MEDPHFFPATYWVTKWVTTRDESTDSIFDNNAFAEYRFVASMFRNFMKREGLPPRGRNKKRKQLEL